MATNLFLMRYYNRYKFGLMKPNYLTFPDNIRSNSFAYKLNYVKSRLSDIKIHRYSQTWNFDPVYTNLNRTNPNLGKIKSGFEVRPVSHSGYYTVFPYGIIPTHHMLRIRDMFNMNGYKTILNGIQYDNQLEMPIRNPFDTKIQFSYDSLPEHKLRNNNGTRIVLPCSEETKEIIAEDSNSEKYLIYNLQETINLGGFRNYLDQLEKEYWRSFSVSACDLQALDIQKCQDTYLRFLKFLYFSRYLHTMRLQINFEHGIENKLFFKVNCPIADYVATTRNNSENQINLSKVPYWFMDYLKESVMDLNLR